MRQEAARQGQITGLCATAQNLTVPEEPRNALDGFSWFGDSTGFWGALLRGVLQLQGGKCLEGIRVGMEDQSGVVALVQGASKKSWLEIEVEMQRQRYGRYLEQR